MLKLLLRRIPQLPRPNIITTLTVKLDGLDALDLAKVPRARRDKLLLLRKKDEGGGGEEDGEKNGVAV